MNQRGHIVLSVIAALTLISCASAPTPTDCDPLRAWQQGLDGKTAEGHCSATDQRLWQEASNLALELRQLMRQRQTLAGPSDADTSLQFVRVQREIDQIVGAAQIRGWPLPDQIRKAMGN